MTKICAHETSTYITGCTATTFPIEEGRGYCGVNNKRNCYWYSIKGVKGVQRPQLKMME